ncbi:hypothetical protein K9N50_03210 [bacterium]|nr:hypothetical protein [bacterium]
MGVLFGELVVDLGYVTQQQLDEVIFMQKKGRAKLGQIMKHLRLLDDSQVEQILNYQKSEEGWGKIFGDCAILLQLVDEKQRIEAVRYQTTSKGVLGDMLLSMGYLTREQLDDVIRQQLLN